MQEIFEKIYRKFDKIWLKLQENFLIFIKIEKII